MFNFEKLEVWKSSIEFTDLIYRVTRSFPADERFGLTMQMRRAATSISSNIAEGRSRSSRADFSRFIEICRRLGYLDESEFNQLYQAAEKLGRMLSGLRNSLMDVVRG